MCVFHFNSQEYRQITPDNSFSQFIDSPGFVSDFPEVFRSDAGQRDGKPQGVGRQMRRLFTRTPVPDVANVRYTGNSRQDVEGRRSGRDVLGMGRLL